MLGTFKPTFLYIKQHPKTGLLYFGKTVCRNVETYKGSGKLWKRHLKVHGDSVDTLWFCLFLDKNDLIEFATHFSNSQNIVGARNKDGEKIWANLIPEDGIGKFFGTSNPLKIQENRDACSKRQRGRVVSLETRERQSAAKNGKTKDRCVNAKLIEIYNQDGILIHSVVGEFKDFCKRNNLPYDAFIVSHRKHSKLYENRNPIRSEWMGLKGWYAVDKGRISDVRA